MIVTPINAISTHYTITSQLAHLFHRTIRMYNVHHALILTQALSSIVSKTFASDLEQYILLRQHGQHPFGNDLKCIQIRTLTILLNTFRASDFCISMSS